MIREKETIKLKVRLWVSCLAFLVMTSSVGIKLLMFHLLVAVMLAPAIAKWPITVEEAKSSISWQCIEAAALLSAMAGYIFYREWKKSEKLQLFADAVGISPKVILGVCGCIGIVAAIPFLACLIMWILERYFNDELTVTIKKRIGDWSTQKAFQCIVLIYIVAFYPLFRANFNYIDDVGRVRFGYDNWTNFSRFLSNRLSHVVHAGGYLTDISPLTQLLAIVIIAIASLIAIRQIRGNDYFLLWDIIAVLPLGLTPYFLECMSYKYDSPYMAISVLASVMPLLFRKSGYAIYASTIIIGMLAMCTTYQAASGIFPMAVVLLVYQMWNKKEPVRKITSFALVSALSYIAGMLIFQVFIMKPRDTYVSNSIGTVSATIEHYKNYIKLVRTDFKRGWLIVIAALTIWFIVVSVYRSKQNKAAALLLSVVTACLMFLLSFGLYPVLSAPLFAPRAMYGVGAYIAFIGLGCIEDKNTQLVTRALTVVLAWSFVTFACTYGNALAVQNEYINFRITEVIEDLTDTEAFNSDEEKTFQIVGNAGYSPVVKNMTSGYNMLERLVPQMFRASWTWGYSKFLNYYDLNEVLTYYEAEDYNDYTEWPVIQESFYHKIHEKDGHFVLELK